MNRQKLNLWFRKHVITRRIVIVMLIPLYIVLWITITLGAAWLYLKEVYAEVHEWWA